MIFGWQGFTLEHPEDWAPISLSGARHEGYARISSPGRISLQVRWKASSKGANLSSVLDGYLERLRRDAKSAKTEFRSDIEEGTGKLVYKYTSNVHGRGAIMLSEPCGRVFFLEAISTKNDSLLVTFRKLLDSFRSESESGAGLERWALFGLDLTLPNGLEVEKKVLQAGRTQLILSSSKVRLEAQRWGFAEQLVAKHGLGPWAKSMMELPNAEMEETSQGVFADQPVRADEEADLRDRPSPERQKPNYHGESHHPRSAMEAVMGLVNVAKGIFSPRNPLDPAKLRSAKPLRNPAVTQEPGEDGVLVLSAPLSQQGRGIAGTLAKWMKMPDEKKFELEPVGAFVWNLCDGRNTFEGISKRLREQFKMNRLEADTALVAFLQMLSQRRLITLLVAKDN